MRHAKKESLPLANHIFPCSLPMELQNFFRFRSGCNLVANTLFYTVTGNGDDLTTIPRLNDFVERLKEKGGEGLMKIEESWESAQICTDIYTPQRLDWVFSHIRQ